MSFAIKLDEIKRIGTKCGMLMRKDKESIYSGKQIDPAGLAKDWKEYLSLASTYAKIGTDRLHFAIAGLMTGADVTLYPNIYHKNKSMWMTWLKNMGCKWSELPA
jgi:exopolysaccharide biosynthesis predicted pyruvyltransferase EpsI